MSRPERDVSSQCLNGQAKTIVDEPEVSPVGTCNGRTSGECSRCHEQWQIHQGSFNQLEKSKFGLKDRSRQLTTKLERPQFPQGWMDVHSVDGSGAAQFSVQGCWWQIPFTTMMLDTTILSIPPHISNKKHMLHLQLQKTQPEWGGCTNQCHHHGSTQHIKWHPLAWHVPCWWKGKLDWVVIWWIWWQKFNVHPPGQ